MSTGSKSWLPREFPERFFGPGNKLDWKEIRGGRLPSNTQKGLAPWLEDLQTGADPLLLPRVREEDDSVEWYALSSTERGARALHEQLLAFVGPSYAGPWFTWSQLEATDPVDAEVMRVAPGRAYRLRLPRRDLKFKQEVREKLLCMRALRKERPARLTPLPRPTGRILGDFEHALRARDGAAAAAHIQEIRRLGRLSAQNQLFLEVLRAECVLAWDDILESRHFGPLLELPRPRRVTQALLRALYARHLRTFEDSGDAKGAIERFKQLWLAYPGLFRTRHGMDAPEVSRCFMMVAAVAEPARPELRDELLATLAANDPARPYLEALAALVPDVQAPVVANRLAAAREAFGQGDVDRAFREAWAHPGGEERLVLLLRCARELDTLEAASQALSAVDAASPAEREAIFARAPLRTHYERLLELATRPPAPTPSGPVPTPPATIPVDPGSWLERLRQPAPWPRAVEVLERGVREWNRSEWLADPARVEATAKELGSARPLWGDEVLRTALPHLLSFLLTPEGPERALKPVLEQLAAVITLDDQVRVEQLQALSEVTEAQLRIGLAPSEYRSALGGLRETWTRVGAASLGDWALDTLDMLVAQPVADRDERTRFFYDVTTYFRQHARRTSREQFLLLRDLARELDLEVPGDLQRWLTEESREDADTDASLATSLAGRRIALYSLKEAVLERVARVIRELAPTARVECFSDKAGGSPSLKHHAATADIFVIATAAAKHAATGFIESNRKPGATTLYAAGQGSASMLRALSEHTSRPRP
jgi:hypothetical protein